MVNFNTFFTAYSDDDDSNLFIKRTRKLFNFFEKLDRRFMLLKESIDMIKDLCRLFYFKMLDDSSLLKKKRKSLWIMKHI
jgi:hypothetical protein